MMEGLENREIAMVRDVARSNAVAVLKHYVENGGLVYNARQATMR